LKNAPKPIISIFWGGDGGEIWTRSVGFNYSYLRRERKSSGPSDETFACPSSDRCCNSNWAQSTHTHTRCKLF